ncbi:MAG: ribosome silencing factor [bacterium]|nr:ribosome silencing factor [Gammaproteobacteria bacterium]HIL96433.1 ribosome silencing factor [Pseudomonadales bacterium]
MQQVSVKQVVIEALEDVKGIQVTCLDVTQQTDITDYMIIVSGTSNRHVKALAGNVVVDAKAAGFVPIGVEGMEDAEWVLIDLADVVVHVMLPAARDFYDIERLWSMGPVNKEESAVIEH